MTTTCSKCDKPTRMILKGKPLCLAHLVDSEDSTVCTVCDRWMAVSSIIPGPDICDNCQIWRRKAKELARQGAQVVNLESPGLPSESWWGNPAPIISADE